MSWVLDIVWLNLVIIYNLICLVYFVKFDEGNGEEINGFYI